MEEFHRVKEGTGGVQEHCRGCLEYLCTEGFKGLSDHIPPWRLLVIFIVTEAFKLQRNASMVVSLDTKGQKEVHYFRMPINTYTNQRLYLVHIT